MSNFSTDTCLTYFTDHIKRKLLGSITLDIQKAFDSVVHDIVCKKLKGMGVK